MGKIFPVEVDLLKHHKDTRAEGDYLLFAGMNQRLVTNGHIS